MRHADIQMRRGAIPALDGVRGLAILLVLLFHCCQPILGPLAFLGELGWIGVDLFFVLSGFLITGILLDKRGDRHYLRNFFARRFLRIFPLYILALILVLVATTLPSISSLSTNLRPELWDLQIIFWTYTQNIYFTFFGWLPGGVLNHFWSLAIEEQFYIFWPFIILIFTGRRFAWVIMLTILSSVLLRHVYCETPFAYVFTLARLDGLALGALVAYLIRYEIEKLRKWAYPASIIGFALLLGVLVATPSLSFNEPIIIRYGYLVSALCFALLIVLLYDKGGLGRWLRVGIGNKILRVLGKYSYGLYIYHWIIYRVFYDGLLAHFGSHTSAIAIFFVILSLVTWASFHLYEVRFLKFKTRFE